MSKTTKALSGASQDAYFRRVLKAFPNVPDDVRDRLVQQLRREIAQVRLRTAIRRETLQGAPPPEPAQGVASTTAALPAAPAPGPFDPYSPNLIVVVRTSGREAALAALAAIDSADNLRLLAREQRLSIGADCASLAEMRAAIVTAAERRIANRKAAAS
ncbi:MAG: hypothetical protein F9K29_20240 [Hyphomicrobiaceae bacterium]|nr:MAG: hypothetical protein F9K29_20240 [Hyphomicrobiaceae bacterium]